jgi:hypothetical protein
LLQGEDYGLFLKHDGNLNGHAVIPKLRQFTDDLVYNYKEGLIRNPNTLHFAHQLLIGFGSQLTHYAFTHEIDEEVLAMWQSVQQTFPGMLATLSTVSANPQYPMPDDVMLGMARRFENSFGIETTDLEIATYYFYLALILVSPDATLEKDETLALSYLNLGLKAFPGPDNPGLCLRSKLIPLAELPGQGNPCQ